MAIIILAVFFSTLVFAFAGTGRYGLRQSFVYAATVYTLCLVLATEFFSIWHILQFETLLAFWTGLTIVSGLYLYFYGNRQAVLHTLNGAWIQFRASKALWVVTLVWSLILAIALVYPPNNWDSMVYHMPRVLSWIQHGSIDFFSTAVLRQLYQQPLAEWNILHFQILSGGDRYANTVQWLALVGCSIAASLITRELKQPFPVQVLALVIAATLPMGLLQGSSTQNDLVVSFWLLTFALFALQYLRKPPAARLAFCGLTLGFALLTKGTAYAVALPLAVMLLLYGIIHTKGARSQVKLAFAAVVILAVALLLNGGHYARNWSLSGNPLYTGHENYRNEKIDIPVLWSNLIRNSALHWGVYNNRINAIILDITRSMLRSRMDIPEATFAASSSLAIIYSKHEDHAGNFLHFWVVSFSTVGILLFRRRFNSNSIIIAFAISLLMVAISYCILLKWQIWGSRLHTPLFMLGAPVAAVFVSSLGARLRGHFTKIFLIMSVPWVFFNETRPIYSDDGQVIFSVDRTEAHFYYFPELLQPYVDVLFYLKEHMPTEVGIDPVHHEYREYPEYPIRVLMREYLESISRVEHISTRNISRRLRSDDYIPQYIISTSDAVENIEGVSYRIVWISPEVIVLARDDIASELVDEMFEDDILAIESNYDVYVRDNALLYVKEPCSREDVEATFFAHVVPVDVNDLADHRRRYSADNLDFRFEAHGWRSGARCLAARRLPTYAIHHVETGQYGPGGGRLWAGRIPSDGEPQTG